MSNLDVLSDSNHPKKEEKSLASKVSELVSLMGLGDQDGYKGAFSKGELAELRRWSGRAPYPMAFWRYRARFSLGRSLRQEEAWALILHVLAVGCRAHTYKVSFGRALFQSGFSELRLRQLLMAEGSSFSPYVRRASQFLVSKGVDNNWLDLVYLILAEFSRNSSERDRVVNNIARDYYSQKNLSE